MRSGKTHFVGKGAVVWIAVSLDIWLISYPGLKNLGRVLNEVK